MSLDRFVAPLVAADLGLSIFATLLMLVGAAMFDPGGSDDLSPIDAVCVVAALCLIPAYFAAVYGVLRRREWGRWSYLGVFVTFRLLGFISGLSVATAIWDLSYEPLYLAYACQGAALFCLFVNELDDRLTALGAG